MTVTVSLRPTVRRPYDVTGAPGESESSAKARDRGSPTGLKTTHVTMVSMPRFKRMLRRMRRKNRRAAGQGNSRALQRGRRRGAKSGQYKVARKVTLSRLLTMGTQPWPDRMQTVMTCYSSTAIAAGTGVQTLCYLANSFGDGTTGNNGCGPQINVSGSFAKNYPAGLKGIIQTPAANGSAITPYASYYITRCRMYYRVVPAPIGGDTAPSSEIRIVAWPTDQLSYSGTSFTSLIEQNGAKFNCLSPGYFGTSTTTAITGGGQPLASTAEGFRYIDVDVARVMGVPRSAISISPNYINTVSTICTNQCFAQLSIVGDGTNNFACDVEVVLKYETIFFQRNNNLSSAVNN